MEYKECFCLADFFLSPKSKVKKNAVKKLSDSYKDIPKNVCKKNSNITYCGKNINKQQKYNFQDLHMLKQGLC